jgi:hypothetical protein
MGAQIRGMRLLILASLSALLGATACSDPGDSGPLISVSATQNGDRVRCTTAVRPGEVGYTLAGNNLVLSDGEPVSLVRDGVGDGLIGSWAGPLLPSGAVTVQLLLEIEEDEIHVAARCVVGNRSATGTGHSPVEHDATTLTILDDSGGFIEF